MSFNDIVKTDPLANALGEPERELFKRLVGVCVVGKFSPQQVAEAALNLLCNSIRQSFPTRAIAERQYDETVGKMKAVLLEQHYDAVTGQRRSTFAFDQIIQMPFNDFSDKFSRR